MGYFYDKNILLLLFVLQNLIIKKIVENHIF